MSLNVQNPLDTRAIIPYSLDYSESNLQNGISVLIGPSNVNYIEESPSGGNTSKSELNFNIYSPNRNSTALNKSVLLKGTFDVTITIPEAITADTPKYNKIVESIMEGRLGMAANPIYSSINNISLNFDGNSITETVSQYSSFIKYLNYDEEALKYWDSYSPNYLDNSFFFTAAQKNSVLNGGDDVALDGIRRPRGAYSYYGFAFNDTTRKMKFKLDVAEPLNLSPFTQSMNPEVNDSGFIGFSNLKISINFKSPENMFNSCVCINPFTSTEITSNMADPVVYTFPTLKPNTGDGDLKSFFTGTCELTDIKLLCKFDTLPVTMLSPEIVNYSYNKLQYITQSIASPLPTADVARFLPSSTPVQLSSYNLSAIPNKVLLAVIPKKVNGTVSGTVTEIPTSQRCTAFMPIHQLDVTFGNQSGILSSCTPQLLYHKTIENGVRFIDWSNSGMSGRYVKKNKNNFGIPLGAPLCLGFGTDIHYTDPGMAPGLAMNGTISYKLSVYNYLNQAVQAEVIIIYFYEGVFTLSSYGNGTFQESLLTKTDILNVSKDNVISTNDLRSEMQFSGGSFWSGLKKIGKKAMKIVKSPQFRKGLSVLGDLDIPGVSQVASISEKLIGDGKGGRLLNSNSNGGRLMSQNDRGSAMVAGAKSMNASQLRNRLMK